MRISRVTVIEHNTLHFSLTKIQLFLGPAGRSALLKYTSDAITEKRSWAKNVNISSKSNSALWWDNNSMHARSREEPLPARAHSRLGYGVSRDTYHGCFKTFQALAQRPRPGLRRLHHSSAGQVCLVSYQHTYPRETTEALHLTGSLGGQLETEKSKQTDF